MKITLTGANELSKLLKRKARIYQTAKPKYVAAAEELSVKRAKTFWFGISDNVLIYTLDTNRGFSLYAKGKDVLFLEFGAGIKYAGMRHPKAHQMGYGPGTYPGKGHWDNLDGWWYPTDDPSEATDISIFTGQYYVHTFGNAAYQPMMNTAMVLPQEIRELVAKELSR